MMNNEPSSAKNSTSNAQQLHQSMISSNGKVAINNNVNTTVDQTAATNDSMESPQVNVHVSQLNAPGLTDCSEDDKEEDDESNRSFDS